MLEKKMRKTVPPSKVTAWNNDPITTDQTFLSFLALTGLSSFLGKMLERATLPSEGFSRPRWEDDDSLPPGADIPGSSLRGGGGEALWASWSPQSSCAHAPEEGGSLQPAASFPGSGLGLWWARVGEKSP